MKKIRVLVYGAGDAGTLVAGELRKNNNEYEIIGFIDDDPLKQNTTIHGIPVLGGRDCLQKTIESNKIDRFIIAIPSIHTQVINRTAGDVLSAFPDISLQILPPLSRYFTSPIVPELEEGRLAELINREETVFDYDLLTDYYSDRTVIVTGAGGSIGSELCRLLIRLSVKKLVCIGRGENSLYLLKKKLEHFNTDSQIEYCIADIKNREGLRRVFENNSGALLLHAAAHKHVHFMEKNVREAVYNNICGTLHVLEAAQSAHLSSVVFISTDKAVNPASIMGKTKRVCERLMQTYNNETFRCFSVRFGNVLGSRGSVVPLFTEQIANGGPVTVTHPDITRFFMTIPEAAMLVLNAALYSQGGDISVLDMGKQYRVLDIAKRLIRLHGLEVDKDIHIKITGLRPGEKLYEELYYSYELYEPTGHPKISRIVKPDISLSEDQIAQMKQLKWNIFLYSEKKVRTLLQELMNINE